MKKILSFNRVSEYVETVLGSAVHAKRRLSLSNAVFGIVMGAQLSITSVGCCERRDRLMQLNALATVLFTLIGAAG